MLLEYNHIKPAKRIPKSMRREDKALVAASPVIVSQQTEWMLSVRDHRDKVAFAALFDHFGTRLKGFIMRSGMPSAQAEEVVQDVMMSVWRKAAVFDPHRAQVSAWIYQIARNRQIDVVRPTQKTDYASAIFSFSEITLSHNDRANTAVMLGAVRKETLLTKG